MDGRTGYRQWSDGFLEKWSIGARLTADAAISYPLQNASTEAPNVVGSFSGVPSNGNGSIVVFETGTPWVNNFIARPRFFNGTSVGIAGEGFSWHARGRWK